MNIYNTQSFHCQLAIFLLILTRSISSSLASETNEYLIKTGEQLATCAVELPGSLEIGSIQALSRKDQQFLLTHYRHAARMAGEFSTQFEHPIVRSTLPTRLIVLDNPSQLAIKTHRPEFDRLGHVVARIDLCQGQIYLSRLNATDLFLEMGKWFFYELEFRWGQDLKADLEHKKLIEHFASFCVAQQVLANNSEELNGSQPWPADPDCLSYFVMKPNYIAMILQQSNHKRTGILVLAQQREY